MNSIIFKSLYYKRGLKKKKHKKNSNIYIFIYSVFFDHIVLDLITCLSFMTYLLIYIFESGVCLLIYYWLSSEGPVQRYDYML